MLTEPKYEQCIEACIRCMNACNVCYVSCLKEYELAKLLDCIAIEMRQA